jgi:heat shock protein HslJ
MTGLLVAGLTAGAHAQSPSAAAVSGLAGSDWLLASIADTPLVSGTDVTLVFTETEAGGFGGCNRFVAEYQADGVSTLTLGPIASTLMTCGEEVDALEAAYLTALAEVAGYTRSADGLVLRDASGGELLTFTSTPPASVEGPWIVTMVNNGAEAVQSAPMGVDASVSFHPDLTVEGFGGCNRFSGAYTVDGDTIAIGPLLSTLMSCGDEVDTFEGRLLTALQAATTWSVEGAILDLRDDTGAQQVAATSAIGR